MNQAFVPEKTSKLVVRVKLDNELRSPAFPKLEPDSGINWTLLFAVVIVVSLFAGAGYYYLTHVSKHLTIFSEFEKKAGENLEVPLNIEQNPSLAEPQIAQTEEAVSTDDDTNEAIIASTHKEPDVVNEDVKSPSSQKTEQTIVQSPGLPEAESHVSASAPVVEENAGNEITLAAIEEPALSDVKPAVQEVSGVVATRAVSSDLSAKVPRFQFTHGIDNREPVDLIEDVVPYNADAIEKIYFFSELRNLEGQTIRHQWLHHGKLISELGFKVRGNRWRVNSSKRLNRAAIGSWQVKVVDELGQVLVSDGFEYR